MSSQNRKALYGWGFSYFGRWEVKRARLAPGAGTAIKGPPLGDPLQPGSLPKCSIAFKILHTSWELSIQNKSL